MSVFRTTLVAVLLAVASVSVMAEQDHGGVMVFTTRNLPAVTGIEQTMRVFYLDGADAALTRLRFANPGNPVQAKAEAVAMLNTPHGQAVIKHLTRVGEGVALAWQHGIEKLPAVMVEGSYVVYGVFDVGTAVRLIEERQHHDR